MQASKRPQLAPLLQVPINQLFIPRPPLPYWKPIDRSSSERTGVLLNPATEYLRYFDREEEESGEIRETVFQETSKERAARRREQRCAQIKARIAQEIKAWSPSQDPKIDPDSNPYKTVLVARMSYETTEKKLCREFERFGPIRSVHIIRNVKTGRSRGYAFVEYEREKDMRCALRDGNGIKIDGRRVVVDVERGRTQQDWRPRRFAGGLGTTRASR